MHQATPRLRPMRTLPRGQLPKLRLYAMLSCHTLRRNQVQDETERKCNKEKSPRASFMMGVVRIVEVRLAAGADAQAAAETVAEV